jgi:hypothetical protein
MTLLGFKTILHKKCRSSKIQRVQQKISGGWTYVQQNENKFQKVCFYKTWDTNAHYNFGIRKFNIIHCQLRNKASNLKAHLFNDFLSDNTNCPNCSGPLEDNNHFLLICPKFNNFRLILLDSIQTLIPTNNNIDINIDLLLHGNRSFSYDLNTEIVQAVHKFISDTHRFI